MRTPAVPAELLPSSFQPECIGVLSDPACVSVEATLPQRKKTIKMPHQDSRMCCAPNPMSTVSYSIVSQSRFHTETLRTGFRPEITRCLHSGKSLRAKSTIGIRSQCRVIGLQFCQERGVFYRLLARGEHSFTLAVYKYAVLFVSSPKHYDQSPTIILKFNHIVLYDCDTHLLSQKREIAG